MGKISPYDFVRVSPEIIDFKDEVTTLLNFGKYSSPVVGTPPTWTARNGEFVFFTSSGVNRCYFYINNVWNFIGVSSSGGTGGTPGGSDTQIQVNSQNTFYADSGFVYNASSAMSVGRDMLIILNNNTGSNTYFLYRASNNYLEYYINGELRLQM